MDHSATRKESRVESQVITHEFEGVSTAEDMLIWLEHDHFPD